MPDNPFAVVEVAPTPESIVAHIGSYAYQELSYRARDKTRWEVQEVEQLRTPDRTLHIEDVPLQERADVAAGILAAGDLVGLDVERVIVLGSWARGEAIPGISDLDVRLVTAEPLDWHGFWAIVRYMRVDVGPRVLPQAFGYLDAIPTPEAPRKGVPLV